MRTVFVIGNIASGKSSACSYLEQHGAHRIDLDQLAKDLYQPGSDLVLSLADAFGWDVLDEAGGIRRSVLASRAFATPEDTQKLNELVHPAVLEQLALRILPAQCCSVMVPEHALTVVEVSVPDSVRDAFALADEVLAITAPLEVRRERALSRGMSLDDFERRAAIQPDEEELQAMASSVISNTGDYESLCVKLDAWLVQHGVDLPRPAEVEGE